MAQVISHSAHFAADRIFKAVSPSYRRVRRQLAMIEAWHAAI